MVYEIAQALIQVKQTAGQLQTLDYNGAKEIQAVSESYIRNSHTIVQLQMNK